MTFGQLEIFVALAEARGFTSAALRLGVSQPAISHALKCLEDEFGVLLFDRSLSPISLTPVGEHLLSHSRQILGLANAMHQEAASHLGVKTGSLRIGSFGASSSLQILPGLLEAFYREYPGIDVVIEEAPDEEVARWIESRHVDLGFVVLPDDRFQTWPLARDQFVALVPMDCPLATQPDVSLEELTSLPFIMPESGSAGIVDQLFVQAGLKPKVRYRTTQLLSGLTMVARGLGVSIVAEMALPEPTGAERWTSKPLRPPRPREIGLAMHPTAIPTPAAQAFVKISTQANGATI